MVKSQFFTVNIGDYPGKSLGYSIQSRGFSAVGTCCSQATPAIELAAAQLLIGYPYHQP